MHANFLGNQTGTVWTRDGAHWFPYMSTEFWTRPRMYNLLIIINLLLKIYL